MMTVENSVSHPEWGEREVPFSREIYVEREDFQEFPEKKFFRLFPGPPPAVLPR